MSQDQEELREFFLVLRRALLMLLPVLVTVKAAVLMVVRWIERRYDLAPSTE